MMIELVGTRPRICSCPSRSEVEWRVATVSRYPSDPAGYDGPREGPHFYVAETDENHGHSNRFDVVVKGFDEVPSFIRE